MTMLRAHDVDSWKQQLKALLPRGRAWEAPADGALDRLLMGLADEFSRAEARINQLIEEADPLAAVELLGEWEVTVGLPDACFSGAMTTADRQLAVAQRMVSTGGQSAAYFIELAARINYTVSIEEFRPARIGDRIGQMLFDDAWHFTWLVHVLSAGPATLNLECLIGRHAPAHTTVIFAYP